MRTIARLVAEIRSFYGSDPDMLRVVLNSVSWVEASLAMELLSETIPEKSLITAANIREAVKELPRCPIAMSLDFTTLAATWQLERVGMSWERVVEDPGGDYTIALLGEGNWCYDIVIRTGGRTLMWMPKSPEEDFLNNDVIDLIMERKTLLKTVIDLVGAMGLPFSPIFYLSLEDWRQEYAAVLFEEVVRIFSDDDDALPQYEAPTPPPMPDDWERFDAKDIRYFGSDGKGNSTWFQ